MSPGFAAPEVWLPELIALHARFRAGRPALIDGARVMSWGAFGAAVDAAAAHLQRAGLAPGDSAALLSRTCLEAVVWQFAILRAGGAVASISTAVSDAALAGMVADCGARLVIADADAARRVTRPVCSLTIVPAETLPDAPAPFPALAAVNGLTPMNIMYSSGTTGSPKGIVLTHRARLDYARILSAALGVNEDSIVLVTTALCSNMSWTLLLCALSSGGCAALMGRFDAQGFCAEADRLGVTHTIMVPTQYRRILDHPASKAARLDSFRAACSVGSAMSPALKTQVGARFAGAFYEIYGMTEGFATLLRPADLAAKADAVGRPMAGNDVRVIDSDDREAAPGEAGEIVAHSSMLMRGYHNDPQQTLAAQWVEPVSGRAFLRSGDIGRIDEDGFVHLVGRKKDMIISGGQNIYPADLERVLSDHPQVSEAVVIGVPDAVWGETPLALVVAGKSASISAEELREWANGRLGRHQRLSAIEFRDALARNDGGKVVKAALREPYWKA